MGLTPLSSFLTMSGASLPTAQAPEVEVDCADEAPGAHRVDGVGAAQRNSDEATAVPLVAGVVATSGAPAGTRGPPREATVGLDGSE